MSIQSIVSNLITNTNTTTTTTNTNEVLPMNTTTIEMNTNALSSTVSAQLFHHIGNAKVSVMLACCVVDAAKLVGDLDMTEAFLELVQVCGRV
jgi:hypothetical protein